MQRSVYFAAALCVFSATLYAGCVFYEDCDYYETQCWDVVDVYCDPWGCWEEVFTECEDYCVDVSAPVGSVVAPECTADRHCGNDQICQSERCVAAPHDGGGGAGLCHECDVNADCAESGALCLNLEENATVGHCGRACVADDECPRDFQCLSLSGASGNQCVPADRVCESNPVPQPDCTTDANCDGGEVCEGGRCVTPAPDCLDNSGCTAPQICEAGACVDPTPAPECVDNTGCTEPQICVDDACVDPEPTPECENNAGCDAPQICLQGSCTDPACTVNGECGDAELCVDGLCEALVVEDCDFNNDCGEIGICVDGSCRLTCADDPQCPGAQVCRAGLCAPPPEPECMTGSDCGAEGDFTCVNGSCRDLCDNNDAECSFGYFCRGFYCDVDTSVECRNTLECGHNERCHEGSCLRECAASCNCSLGLSCDETLGLCMDLPFPETCETSCDCPGGYECNTDMATGTCQLQDG